MIKEQFEHSMENIEFPLAVAVSGGSDSLALLLLAHELAQRRGSHVVALTVDHGLRSESKEEAIRVGSWAKERDIQHVILDWVGDKPITRLQESARKARYGLLTQWCKQNQISTLLLGHHQQDQEETFWLRLSSGSGLDGLSGIKKRTFRDGILFLRPLLDFPKERLKETLLAHNQEWIEDPSNQSSRFFRGRMRQFLSEEGLSSFRLSQIMKKFQGDGDFIQVSVTKAINDMVQLNEGGYLTVKKDSFNELHPAIAKRLLSFLLQWFLNPDYPPRESKIIGILEKIKKESFFTAGGIYWVFSPEEIFLFRERRAIDEGFSVSVLKEKTLWDQRFWIDPRLKDYVPNDIVIGPLGVFNKKVSSQSLEEGVVIQKSHKKKLDCDGAYAPRNDDHGNLTYAQHIVSTLPALWLKGKVVAVPHLCYSLLECENDLRKFINLKPLFHDSLRFTI
jgi:tRNA(Ile)-lysidine synthase